MHGYLRATIDLEVWDKVPGQPVSETDLAVDSYLQTELLALAKRQQRMEYDHATGSYL